MRIVSISAKPFETPLIRPFTTSQGSAYVAKAVAIHLTLEDGFVARGESVPVQYVTGETIESVLADIRNTAPSLIGLPATAYRTAFEAISTCASNSPSARCGMEMAVLDASAKFSGVSLFQLLGGARSSVESDITIPISSDAPELAKHAWEAGFRVLKVKVGGGHADEEIARVRSLIEAAPEAILRIDANQAFTPEHALAFAERLVAMKANIQLLEQPVMKEDFEGLGWVAERSPIPIFADESCRTPAHALRLVTTTSVQGLNLKINKCGIQGVLDIIAIARAAKRKLMIGCMLESRRSIAVSLAIACGTGHFDYCDIDSHLLLNETGVNEQFEQNGPVMSVLEVEGIE